MKQTGILGLALLILCGRVAPAQSVIYTLAGGVPPPTPVAATAASIGSVVAVAADAAGNIYFTSWLNCVFRLARDGVVTRVAGACRSGYSGDGGPALNAQLSGPGLTLTDHPRSASISEPDVALGLAVDARGNLYIADAYRVRKVSPDGGISTIAGTGIAASNGVVGDGGSAAKALLGPGLGLALDSAGNLYLSDAANNRVRKVSAADGIITTVAGRCAGGTAGDAATSCLKKPYGLAMDRYGNLYIADAENNVVRQVTTDGQIRTVAGTGKLPDSRLPDGDGGPAIAAQLAYPRGVAVDNQGNVFIADTGHCTIRRVTDGVITTVAGLHDQPLQAGCGYAGDGGPATSARLDLPRGVAVDGSGNLFIADTGNGRLRKVDTRGTITTAAGNGLAYSGDGGAAIQAQLYGPRGIIVDRAGAVYVADSENDRLRKISPDGVISTVASVRPNALAMDGAGNLYFDSGRAQVTRLSPSGAQTILATGNTTEGITALAVDAAGNVYVNDYIRVRKITADGTVSIFAGNGYGTSGDGGPAAAARFSSIEGLAVDAAGTLYISDYENHRIRMVSRDGTVSAFAGTGTPGGSGDGGPAKNAQLYWPRGLACDSAGNLYVAEARAHRIRRIAPDGTISTVAGNGYAAYSGDGGAPKAAALNFPAGVAVDAAGRLYIADTENHAVRVLASSAVLAVTNAGSNLAGAVAPAELISIYGVGLGPAEGARGAGLQKGLGGTRVFIGDTEAFLAYSRADQVNALAPSGFSGSAGLVVEYQGSRTLPFTLAAAPSSPGLFTMQYGAGQAVVVNEDNSFNSESNPAPRGSIIAFWATGQGLTNPALADGQQPAGPDFPQPSLLLAVSIGGVPADVVFKGLVYGGVLQVNAKVPQGAPSGLAELLLTIGGASSRKGVILAVK